MTYTPINWQTGDTITAEKMNKMDNGWSVESTQLFSETVTTAGDGMYSAELDYSGTIDDDSITVTFDGTEYTCQRIDAFGQYYYGGFTVQGPVFTEYPFAILSDNGTNKVYTETASTHAVSVTAGTVETSSNFRNAVLSVGALPMLCVSDVTYLSEIEDAIAAGQLVYFWTSSHGCFFITKVGRPFTIFPESIEVTATYDNTGLLIIIES